VAGLRGRAAPARGTYRSVLYALAGEVHGPASGRVTPFAGAKAPPPYSRDERAGLVSMAGAQRGAAVLGAGDGVVRNRGRAAARRAGRAARRPHRAGRRHRGDARGRPGAPRRNGRRPLRPAPGGPGPHCRGRVRVPPGLADRGYKNFVSSFAARLAADPAAPRLSMGRCRATFICDHLAAGTPLDELLASTGIREAESLARYARHVQGAPSRAALRARDKSR